MGNADEILSILLKKIAQEQGFVNYELKIKPISSGGANFSSTLFNVTIAEGEKNIHMFAKVATAGEQLRIQAPMVYETEIFAYTKLTEVYKELEIKHKIPEEHKLRLSKIYGCNPKKYEETLVLEDLVQEGYTAFDRFNCFDIEYAKSALCELSKMHALSFAYSYYHSEEFKERIDYVNKGNWVFHAGASLVGYLESVFAMALENAKEETKDKLQRFFETFDKTRYADFYKASGPSVLGHGDYRPSNLMHKRLDDGRIDIRIVDLQTLYGGSPVLDLLFFIFTGSDEQFRKQHYEDLLEHYYTQLHACMRRLNLDPEQVYSKELFLSDLEQKLVYGLLVAIITLPIMLVKEAPAVGEDLNFETFTPTELSDLYVERLNGIINDYVNWGILK